MRPISRLVVCGVGLIGGSVALALRAARAVHHVVGVGRSRASLEAAHQLGVIDDIAEDWARALPGAEIVLIATPVGQIEGITAAMAPYLESGTIVTDAGSTKRDVVAAVRRNLAQHLSCVVPAHPIAGAESSGIAAAQESLYRNRRAVVTPLAENAPAAIERVCELWRACGAVVSQMSPDEHDKVFAAVSHLPHLLAFALVHEFATREDAESLFGFAAGGFRDFTRIASSHPEMWRDIFLANREALIVELDGYVAQLSRLRAALAGGDGAALEAICQLARDARNAWLAGNPPVRQ